jgi:diadenosine tetraphosphatase ApaH/serine/threonine PP2A family protein phosphatase
VRGNHDDKLLRKLQGREVTISHGLAESLRQLEIEPPEFLHRIALFLDNLPNHIVLDHGRLVVAHAGLREEYQGRSSNRVRTFALYGDTTGETDEHGLPIRRHWAHEYRGKASVVYGHTPVITPVWEHRTLCIDTGCVFGGSLTALRYPELDIVYAPASKQYCEPKRGMVMPLEDSFDKPDSVEITDHASELSEPSSHSFPSTEGEPAV